ncbi:hypothetical protein ACLOJK_000175 [Asimina triloba]
MQGGGLTPYYQFTHFTANQAIIDAFEEEEEHNDRWLHVTDFDVSKEDESWRMEGSVGDGIPHPPSRRRKNEFVAGRSQRRAEEGEGLDQVCRRLSGVLCALYLGRR